MEKKKLLILTPGFPENEQDSTTIPYFQALIKALQLHWEIAIVSFHFPYQDGHYQWNNIPVYCAGGKNKRYIARIFTYFRVWKEMTRLHKKHSFEAILCFWLGETSIIGQRFAQKHNLQIFTYMIGQDAKAQEKLLFALSHYPIQIIAASLFAKETFQKAIQHKPALRKKINFFPPIQVIPIGVSSNETPQQAIEKSIDIIGVGSLIPLKRWDLFILIIQKIQKQHPHIQATIIGSGIEKDNLTQLIASQGLDTNIQLVDLLPREKILEMMHKSKILLHTSEYEGQGYVIVEALQQGCYVVANQVGFLPQNAKVQAISDTNRDIFIENASHAILGILVKECHYNPEVYEIEKTISDFQAVLLQ